MTPPHGEPQRQPDGDQGSDQPSREHGQQQYGEQQYGYPYAPPPPQYGQPGYGAAPWSGATPGPPPDNHLVWAILSTVFCCLPLGIVSIVKSAQVNTLWAQGQYDAAHKSADDAKKWAMWSAIATVGIYLAVIVVYLVIFLVFGGDIQTS